MHNTGIQYIRSVIRNKYTSNMHNLKTNFNKFFNITKSVFKDRLNQSDNFHFYPNKPILSYYEIIALSVSGESFGIDSESYFWGKLKFDHEDDFPRLIDRGNFNRRRNHLYPFIEQLNQYRLMVSCEITRRFPIRLHLLYLRATNLPKTLNRQKGAQRS
jgi:hypothetical protein